MRHAVLALLFLFGGMSAQLSAIDWGSTVNSTTSGRFGTSTTQRVTESAQLSAFVRHTFSDQLELSGKGYYRFDTTIPFDGDPSVTPYLFGVERLYATGNIPMTGENSGVISYRAGRFRFSDATGLVLDDRLDGFRLEIRGDGTMRFAGGYSGLTSKRRSSIEMTRADAQENGAESGYTAPKRVVGQFGLVFPPIADRHEVEVSGLYQHDFRPDSSLSSSQGTLSTGYGSLRVRGPIGGRFSYRAFGTFQLGEELSEIDGAFTKKTKYGYLGGASIRYLNQDALYSLVELRYIHSSGDSDYRTFYEGNTNGPAQMFTAMSDPGLGTVFAPRLGNLMVANASYSFQPLSAQATGQRQRLQLRLAGYGYFRERAAAISATGLRADSDGRYLGAETDVTVNYRPFSDLGFSFGGGVFFPNTYGSNSPFDPDRRAVEYSARITTSFSF